MGRRHIYIHQDKNWPAFYWDQDVLARLLTEIRHKQGRLAGRMEALGFNLRSEAVLQTISLDVIKSSEIEGEFLNPDQVRSSVARRLGINAGGLVQVGRDVEGVVEMMIDATQHYRDKLTKKRLYSWHSAMFPAGLSGMYKITVGHWRKSDGGPMQVVSGAMGREYVHFEAPEAGLLENEMRDFLLWLNAPDDLDPVLKAAIAHLWFVTIHPFDDGNGRIARAITDMLLARADQSPQRFYSMSAQIQRERKMYYDMLETTQKGSLDISGWLDWFLHCLDRSLDATTQTLETVMIKARFWERHMDTSFHPRQKLMLNKLFDHFEGKLNTSKWAKMAKCSQDTAMRDIQELIDKNILTKDVSGGRSTSYSLVYV